MNIRKANTNDIDRILEVYDIGREFMRAAGNANQWVDGYPQRAIVEEDIANGNLYVGEQDGAIKCVFAFIGGTDPTYLEIENGEWLDDGPYSAIHRVASDGTVKGVFAQIADYCKERSRSLRIDTHEDNAPMRRAVEKAGFTQCGTIYLPNGDPRIAFQYVPPVRS